MSFFTSSPWEGIVRILVYGKYPERFLSIGSRKGISFYQIVRKDTHSLFLSLPCKQIFLLRPFLKKTGCRFHILHKTGFPFMIDKLHRRKGFLWGMFLCIALFFTVNSFLWGIDVNGNVKVTTQEIYDHLEKVGIRPGVLRYGLDVKQAADTLLLEVEEFSWAFVQVKGTKVKVSVAERKEKPEIVSTQPCDLVAKKDGFIENVTVKAGEGKVRSGQTVRRGEVLVSGLLIPKIPGTAARKVHSIGSVEAKTWYSKTVEAPWKKVESTLTERSEKQYAIHFCGRKIKWRNTGSSFLQYDKIEKEYYVFPEILGNVIGMQETEFRERKEVTKTIDENLALKEALDSVLTVIRKDIPANARETAWYYHLSKRETLWRAEVVVECLEDITEEAEIREVPPDDAVNQKKI